MHLLGVRLSVRLSIPTVTTAANFAVVAQPTGDIGRLQHSSAAGKCG